MSGGKVKATLLSRLWRTARGRSDHRLSHESSFLVPYFLPVYSLAKRRYCPQPSPRSFNGHFTASQHLCHNVRFPCRYRREAASRCSSTLGPYRGAIKLPCLREWKIWPGKHSAHPRKLFLSPLTFFTTTHPRASSARPRNLETGSPSPSTAAATVKACPATKPLARGG